MSADPSVNLFVYGSLADSRHLRNLLGREYGYTSATLPGFARVENRQFFTYIVPAEGGEVRGFVVALPQEKLARLDAYEQEGGLYRRRPVRVLLADGSELVCQAYVGMPERIIPLVARGFTKEDQFAAYAEGRIRGYLHDKPANSPRRDMGLRAREELLDEAVDELVRDVVARPGLPAFLIRTRLTAERFPTLDWLQSTPEAAPYARAYLELLVRFVVLNAVERQVRRQFPGETQMPDRYFARARSLYAALKFLNDDRPALDAGIREIVPDPAPAADYLELVAKAAILAEELYGPEHDVPEATTARVRALLEELDRNRRAGQTPLGAELEFSEIGHACLAAAPGRDERFDSFYWFDDFDLGHRGWKLGIHVDDHGFITPDRGRTRGFLEIAFGRYRIAEDLSKPVTDDLHLLSALTRETVAYFGLRPHSIHVSLEVDPERPCRPFPSVEWLKALLLLGGDFRVTAEGLKELRLAGSEIVNPRIGLVFSRHNQHYTEAGVKRVVEYQFPRLFADHDYQPLLSALLGLTAAMNPCPFKDVLPGTSYPAEYAAYEAELLAWGRRPNPLPDAFFDRFTETVKAGLASQGLAPADVALMLERIRSTLAEKNRQIQQAG
jgi:gamma-glutamylcyclotransferase (GGCT)/AIG2-like uncharacterized protein YtfP